MTVFLFTLVSNPAILKQHKRKKKDIKDSELDSNCLF